MTEEPSHVKQLYLNWMRYIVLNRVHKRKKNGRQIIDTGLEKSTPTGATLTTLHCLCSLRMGPISLSFTLH